MSEAAAMLGYMKETIHSMLRRCIGWDYSQPCIYMITVVLADRQSQALGRLEGGIIADNRTPDSPHIALTPLGRAVEECWEAIPRFYQQVKIIAKQVMPDHFHGILWVKEPLGCHLGQVIKGFKLGCNKAARGIAGNIGDNRTTDNRTPGLFAEGFQDTILFREGQLEKMIAYIKDNPRRLAEKRANPRLFTRVADLAVPVNIAGSVIADNIGDHRTLHFSAIGNRALLERPMIQVQCSRRFLGYRRIPKPGGGLKIARDAEGRAIVEFATPEFEEKRSELLAAARHGAAVISPCISDGEKQIAREALDAGLPLIVMQNKGFAPLQKPAGRYFDACAAGRLLMLAPAAWPYTPAEKKITRQDALAMNRLCEWLAGSVIGDNIADNRTRDNIGDHRTRPRYHGRTPADIDSLALAAARRS